MNHQAGKKAKGKTAGARVCNGEDDEEVA